jgi:NADPH:quinone reductase-like Zn-dependent oxidoreductase
MGTFVCSENNEDLLVLTALIESGKITPVIDKTYPLSEVPAAIRYLKDGPLEEKSSSRFKSWPV